MEWYWILPVFLLGGAACLGGGFLMGRRWRRGREAGRPVPPMIVDHFRPVAMDQITVSERKFPHRVRADLQLSMDRLFSKETTVMHFCGLRQEYAFDGLNFSSLLVDGHSPAMSVPPEYEDVDVGDAEPVRCLKNGLWLLVQNNCKYVMLVSPSGRHGQVTGIQIQIASVNNPDGTRIAREFFRHLEDSVHRAESYRGKVLSLEQAEHSYSGESAGITVHRLAPVGRDQVILPAATLELLERNVIRFVSHRTRLKEFGQATKKGLLFYGPPGTGKTLTVRYLAQALPGHTTLLIAAEQVGLLGEYMTLARLLQPSVVVIEDVDLIARDRATMSGPCEESLLNKLLNEMDGLKEEADILFILTTNRPETLEAALASRPGRIDQSIEFPPPDAEGRSKLIRLYARGAALDNTVVEEMVRRTTGVSGAFIKELMRRTVQVHLDRNGAGTIESADADQALNEMLFRGGSLNLRLLGAADANVFRPSGDD